MNYDLTDPEVQVIVCESQICERTMIEIQDGGCTDVEPLFPAYPYFLVNEFGDLLSARVRMTEMKAAQLNAWYEAKGVERQYIRVVEEF